MGCMTSLQQAHVLLEKNDMELAKLKGIEISKFCRDALHAIVTEDMHQDIDKMKRRMDELDTSTHKMMIERNTLNEKVRAIEKQSELLRHKQENDKTEQENAGKLCVICHSFLHFQPNGIVMGGSKIHNGEFTGRYVCGSCFPNAWTEHRKEWWD